MNGRRSGSTRGKLIGSIPGWLGVGWGGGDSLCGDIIFLLVSGVEVLELLEAVWGGGFMEGAELFKT